MRLGLLLGQELKGQIPQLHGKDHKSFRVDGVIRQICGRAVIASVPTGLPSVTPTRAFRIMS